MQAVQAQPPLRNRITPAPVAPSAGDHEDIRSTIQARLWRRAAACAQERGDHHLGLQAWLKVREIDPDSLDARFHIACCFAQLGDRQRACLLLDSLVDRADAPPRLRECAARMLACLDPDPA